MLIKQLKSIYSATETLKALSYLENPEQYPNLVQWNEFDSLLKLICVPSFEPYTVWLLHKERNTSKTYWVRRVTFDPITSITSITYGADSILPTEETEQLLEILSTLSIHPFETPSMIGLDGTSYSIEFGNFWKSCSLTWWSSFAGKEWEPVVKWYEKAVNYFEKYLPESTANKNK